MPKRYRKLRGDSAYYPFAARTALRSKQRRRAGLLQVVGIAALAAAAVLAVRQTLLNDGMPAPPPAAASPSALPAPGAVAVAPQAATRDALAETGQADAAAHTAPEAAQDVTAGSDILPAYRDLYEQNPDLIGWLRMEGAGIDLPVMQTPGDNEYYLRRGFDRYYAVGGTPFLDANCRVTPGYATANWLIYGHNMADGARFAPVLQYRDEAFYQAHPTFTFDTIYEPGTWQVVAALDTALGSDTLPYYTFFDAANQLEWKQRVQAILALRLYDTGVQPQYGDQLLVLSTCGDTTLGTDKRFALLAVRVKS